MPTCQIVTQACIVTCRIQGLFRLLGMQMGYRMSFGQGTQQMILTNTICLQPRVIYSDMKRYISQMTLLSIARKEGLKMDRLYGIQEPPY